MKPSIDPAALQQSINRRSFLGRSAYGLGGLALAGLLDPRELAAALHRSLERRDGPTLIEVPVGAMPSPWEFLRLPPNRGKVREKSRP